MKKIVLTLVALVQFGMVMAQDLVALRSEKVRFYRQPSSQADIIKTVDSRDEVILVRKFNNQWSIVTVGTETGYMHNSKLGKAKKQAVAAAQN